MQRGWCCMAQGYVHTAQPSPWDRSNILTRQQPGVVLWWWHTPGCAQEADPQAPSCRDQTQIHSDYIHLTLVTSKAPDFHKKPGSCSSWMSFPPIPYSPDISLEKGIQNQYALLTPVISILISKAVSMHLYSGL